jgi:hypothetical protein
VHFDQIKKVGRLKGIQEKKKRLWGPLFTISISICYLPYLIDACAAASLAIGTLKGEQLT